MKESREVIKHPIVTEKSTDLKEINWYIFSVDKKSNKKEIKNAVEDIFKVEVDKVRTLIIAGKNIKKTGRVVGRGSAFKKAYVKLKKGKIEFFEGV